MSDFRFANPNGIHVLWLVFALIGLLFWLDRRGRQALDRFLSSSMQTRLSRSLPPVRRGLSILLLGLSGVALVVAWMRPQWGLSYVQTPRVGAQIMVCLDVSNSMLAEDTAPNRLERAKAELSDLLGFLDGDQVGLIAFAGRASVLCPLTPDFGFFKLILDGANPQSVGRGGTRLEEPIRKAVAGFRTETDVSRAILLVTDGEDHDSYPLEAAKEAAERGIKIITVGFGDEAGSQIQITDPRTGARSVLQDASGQPVVTRLDGETLREIAQLTAGAYVPAGTGALDLNSIYEVHIQPLTRGRLDDRGHAVRREGFQWAVLAGLVLLVGSVLASRGPSSEATPAAVLAPVSRRGHAAAALAWLAWITFGGCATGSPQWVWGQQPVDRQRAAVDSPDDSPKQAQTPGKDATAPGNSQPSTGTSAGSDDSSETVDPRAAYNQAVSHLDSDPDLAEQLLATARREAREDGETRYRSTFNLGWVEVKRADKLLSEKPAEALQHLQQAANWFRDAIRLRPESTAARQNLEIVLRRATELADSLRPQEPRDLARRLDELIVAQRALTGTASGLLQQVAADADPNAAERFRDDYRQLKLEQARILAENQAALRAAREELDSLEAKKTAERPPEEELRAAQLTGVLQYSDRAGQRMGQARSQMRRAQGARAFRRAAAALEELKRARDQLREPAEVLGVILSDAGSLAGLTRGLAATRSMVATPDQHSPLAPAWLTREYLEETQISLTERTDELTTRLKSAAAEHEPRPIGPQPPNAPPPAEDPTLEAVREALPFLAEGTEAFRAAQPLLATDDLNQAGQHQLEAIRALQAARERFLDLRGLIELTYGIESQIENILAPSQDQDPDPTDPSDSTDPKPADPKPTLRFAAALQEENIARAGRLARMLERQPIDNTNAANPTDEQGQQAAQAEQQRRELARQLLAEARDAMFSAVESLRDADSATSQPAESNEDRPDSGGADPAAGVDPAAGADGSSRSDGSGTAATGSEADPRPAAEALEAARPHVGRALERLQELRRLYFSIVEHLQETAQRQAQLNDETEQVAAAPDTAAAHEKSEPLNQRQQELTTTAGQIAAALREQSEQPATTAQPAPTPPQPADSQPAQADAAAMAEQLRKAAELVAAGEAEMRLAGESMSAEQPAWKRARQHQDTALEKLVEALSLLVPPQQQQDRDQQQQQQSSSSQDSSEQEKSAEPQSKDQDEQLQGTDPARLLQAVRDREARRRRDKSQRAQADHEPVEKDW